MKRVMQLELMLLVLLLWTFPTMAQVQTTPHMHTGAEHKFYSHDEVKWQEGPAALPKGAKIAVLEGDLSKEGPFTLRVMFPGNYKIQPHWHPAIEHVTVLKGAFYMGTGEEFSMNKAKKLEASGYAIMPAKFVHYAFTKGETIIQVHGMGPWGITYVNAADDPRAAK